MQGKRTMVGFLSLLAGTAWLVLVVAQGSRLALARTVIASDESILFRLSVVPTLILAGAGALLVVPLLLGGTGAMLGVQACMRVVHACSLAGLAASAVVVLAFGAMVLPTFGARLGPGSVMELAGAANLFVLHGLLLWGV